MQSFTHNWRDCLSFFASDLFKQVQMAALFADSKTFADAVLKSDLQTILDTFTEEQRRAAKEGVEVDLQAFVATHFEIPDADNATTDKQFASVAQYIEFMWEVLTRTPDTQHQDSLIALTRPYIVPGGRFREIYYWDSYFTALGLVDAGHTAMAVNMLENFIDIINEVGCVPNGNRAYYHSRSQPPVLALFYDLLKDELTEEQKRYVIDGLKKEYAFWMQSGPGNATSAQTQMPAATLRVVRLPCGAVLNRYFDTEPTPRPESYREDIETAERYGANKEDFYRNVRAACESGWDFSSRWLSDPQQLASIRTTEILPVDLNALLVSLEQTLASVTEGAEHDYYHGAAKRRIQAIQTYLFSEQKGGYFDFHFPSSQQTNVVSAAMSVPLFVGFADKSQAQTVQNTLRSTLLRAGGIVTTASTTSQQWDSPNGWAPLQLFAVEGLLKYHFNREAVEIMQRFCRTIEAHYASSGVLLEKYNVCEPNIRAGGGEYDVQFGFGWTNGVYIRFQKYLATMIA